MAKANEKAPKKEKSAKGPAKAQAKTMKKFRRMRRRTLYLSFTLCFAILSLLIIANHYFGGDSKGMILIGLNPILKSVSFSEFGMNVLSSGPAVAAGGISVYWYIAHLLTFVLYGAVVDVIQTLIIRLIRFIKTAAKGPQVNRPELKRPEAVLPKTKEVKQQSK
ncbi:hypothetical protein [Acetanaerobacterium elongatum]|uniref:Uncharacterized protein n=1 Tax=Acetanaerobacterium elongatum TaxID=258515 RepID=A0A1H0CAN3_9FIRM|nr:hypothetical protein [Acetanaerobacterium elongatum]SDN54876.1 hypothetical protein SAMN05192585_12240 [Acetanaerobacterium elongatum]